MQTGANAAVTVRRSMLLLVLLAACSVDGSGLVMAPGWHYHSLGAWRNLTPNRMTLAPDGRWLYFGSEISAFSDRAAVAALNTGRGRTHLLVEGFANVNGVRFAPDGSLWVAEGGDQGEIWRMAEPEQFPDDQRVNAVSRESTHPGLAPYRYGGRFNHRAIAFSADQRFAYLADANDGGSLYRLDITARRFSVLHRSRGWLTVAPEDARAAARTAGAARFAAISDIEPMPDGGLLLVESGAGRLLRLDDGGEHPVINTWLQRNELARPDDASWDASRRWWWISDRGSPSTLWAWDGHQLHRILHHPAAVISGVLVAGDRLFVNLQRARNNPSMTLLLSEAAAR